MHTIQQRLMAACGAAFVVLAVVGNDVLGRAGEAPGAGASAAEVARFAAAQQATFDLAAGVELLALAALAVFFAAIAARLRAASAESAAAVILVAGGAMVAVKLASAPPMIAAVQGAGTLPDETVALLVRMNEIAFVTTWPLLGVVLLSVAAAWRSGALPRVAAWAAAPIGFGLLLVPLGGTVDANFLPMLLAMVWLLATSVAMVLRAPRAIAAAGIGSPATSAAPAAAGAGG
jgi:hypothetical protein